MKAVLIAVILSLISVTSFADIYTYEKVENMLKISKTSAETKTLNVLNAEKASLTSQIARNISEAAKNTEEMNIKVAKQNDKLTAKNEKLQILLDQKNTEITEAINLGIVEEIETIGNIEISNK